MDRHLPLPPGPASGSSYQLPPLAHLCSSLPSPTSVQKPVMAHPSTQTKKELSAKEMRSRMLQAERKRQWRHNQTPEQKERRKRIDANRKRLERERLTEEQRAENRRKDAARKAAKRYKGKTDQKAQGGRSQYRRVETTGHGQEARGSSSSRVRTTSLGKLGQARGDFSAYRHSSKQHSPTSIQSLLN